MQIQPYLFFDGHCDEALEFYKSAVGAQVTMLMRFKDGPKASSADCGGAAPPPEKVMHANVVIGDSTVLFSDGNSTGQPKFDGFALTLQVATEAEADQKFAALLAGGAVTMPLGKTFFSKKFGMLKDKFGVHWMVMVQG